MIETPYGIQNGEDALDALMATGRAPSVVMCGNDVLAVGALRRAQEIGLRVTEDISITGFDDIELAMISDPELTTVHVPHRDMGRSAARVLVNMVRNPQQRHSGVDLKISLKLRGSLGGVC